MNKREKTYTYDGLSRLTQAGYFEGGSASSKFGTQYTYDLMGNMQTLKRYGLLSNNTYGLIDDLSYTYSGNQVTKVTDAVTSGPSYAGAFHFIDGSNATTEYEYDNNGNLTKDLNKNISSIQYNSLNLPSSITYQNGNMASYAYNSAGVKLTTSHTTGGVTATTQYCGSAIYDDGALSQLLIDGGYITFSGTTPQYHYFLQDHLGSNRVVVNESGTAEQVTHYYPFGGIIADLSTGQDIQKYKYNGKELDGMHGLNTYDYGARQYNPVTARWDRVDPLAEKYYSLSPYNYCGGNPIRFVDLHGDSLILSGSAEDIKATLKVYQDGLGGFYNVSLNNMGYVTLTPNMNKNPQEMTTSELTVFKKLMPILYEEKITKINVINNSAKVPIGDISTNSIDIGDISALNGYKHVTPISALMHETLENHYVQDPKFMTNNSNRVKYAHFHSMSFEHSYMGDGNVHNLYDSETGILDFRTYDPILNTYGESLEKIQFTNGNLR